MKRALVAAVLVLPLLAAAVVAVPLLTDRPGGDGRRPAGLSAAPPGMRALLATGDIVVETDLRAEVPALEAEASRVMGMRAHRSAPGPRRRGMRIHVRHNPASEGTVVYSDDGVLRVSGAGDARLRGFLVTALGRG